MLEARSQTDISQITAQAPNVTLKPQGSAFGPSLAASIRGVGQYDFNPALEPGVGLYVDDVYYATLTGAIFDLLDLDRVEVLRGPQGTLAGKNSIGGAVKLYSKKPTGDGSGYISGTYGSRNRVDLRASADFKLAPDLFMRLAGVAKKQEGYVKRLDFGCVNPPGTALNPSVGGVQPETGGNCVVARDGEVDYQAVRGQLRYNPSDRLDINIIADYTHDDRNNAAGVLLQADNTNPNVRGDAYNVPYDNRFVCGRYCNYASYFSPASGPTSANPAFGGYPLVETRGNGRSKFNGWGVSGQVDFDLTDDIQLQSITAYRAYTLHFNNDDDYSPLAISNGFGDLDYWGFTQEVRLNGKLLNDTLNWTLGGFYLDQRSTYATFQDLRYAAIPLQFQGDDPVNADTKAVFGAVSWEFVHNLTFNGGLRYTDEHKDYTFSRRNRDGTINPFLGALDGVTGKYNGDRLDWRANLQYRFSPSLMTYAQDNDMRVYGHNLVWYQQTPAWFFNVSPTDSTPLTNSPADQAILNARLDQHIDDVAKYLSTKFGKFGSSTNPLVSFDVVNEAVSDNAGDPEDLRQSRWYQVLGESYIVAAYLDGYAPRYGLPPAYSTNRSYGYFDPPPESVDTVLYVARHAEPVRGYFGSADKIATVNDDLDIYLLSRRQQPWQQIWRQLRTLTVS